MKVLNLYAGVGGNRKLWRNVEVTAVEKDTSIAQVYQDLYPADTLIVGDAHKYLAEHYTEFDFIWSSPPCQSHSSMRQNLAVRFRGTPAVYPDMKLYQEIIFLQSNSQCQWVVENVKPYYNPLIQPSAVLQRHCFWSSFPIDSFSVKKDMLRSAQIDDLQEHTGIKIDHFSIIKGNSTRHGISRSHEGVRSGARIVRSDMPCRAATYHISALSRSWIRSTE